MNNLFYRKNLLPVVSPKEGFSGSFPKEGSSVRTQIVLPEEGFSKKLSEEGSSGRTQIVLPEEEIIFLTQGQFCPFT